jgi:hypothetical protein
MVHASPELGVYLAQLRLQPFAHRLPQHCEHSVAPLTPAYVREAEEIERLRFPFCALLLVHVRERPEFQQACLLRVQFQLELVESLHQLRPELAKDNRCSSSYCRMVVNL